MLLFNKMDKQTHDHRNKMKICERVVRPILTYARETRANTKRTKLIEITLKENAKINKRWFSKV